MKIYSNGIVDRTFKSNASGPLIDPLPDYTEIVSTLDETVLKKITKLIAELSFVTEPIKPIGKPCPNGSILESFAYNEDGAFSIYQAVRCVVRKLNHPNVNILLRVIYGNLAVSDIL